MRLKLDDQDDVQVHLRERLREARAKQVDLALEAEEVEHKEGKKVEYKLLNLPHFSEKEFLQKKTRSTNCLSTWRSRGARTAPASRG